MNITAVGKFLDQPVLISKLKDKTPKILTGAAFAYGIYDVYKTPKENRKNRAIKDGIILSATVSASLISAFGLKIGKKQLLKGLVDIKDAKSIISDRKIVIDKFLKKNNVDKKTETLSNPCFFDLFNVLNQFFICFIVIMPIYKIFRYAQLPLFL